MTRIAFTIVIHPITAFLNKKQLPLKNKNTPNAMNTYPSRNSRKESRLSIVIVKVAMMLSLSKTKN
jgi:hypothetical protein